MRREKRLPKNHRAVRPIDGKTKSAGALDPVEDFNNPLRKEQADLPGMENRGIEEIETAAKKYAGLRDRRMELNGQEAQVKTLLMALMAKHEKKIYERDGIHVEIVPVEETVKVKVTPESDDAPARKGVKIAVQDKSDAGATDRASRSEAQSDGAASPEAQGTGSEARSEDRPTQGQSREPGSDDF